MALIVNYADREYTLEIEEMDTDEARAMERFGVRNLKALEEGIAEGDTSALTVAYWLMLKQNGEPGARLERVKFQPIKFLRALGDASRVEREKEAESALGKEPRQD